MSRPSALHASILTLAAVLVGCTDDTAVTTQSVPPLRRELFAISTGSTFSCFVRLEAAKPYVDEAEEAFREVVRSIETDQSSLTFDVPDGFTQSEIREAPTGLDGKYELAPNSGAPYSIDLVWFRQPTAYELKTTDIEGFANQSRRRLSLPEWSGSWREAAEDAEQLAKLETDGLDWYVLDFVGVPKPPKFDSVYMPLPEFDYRLPDGWDEKPAGQFLDAKFERTIDGEPVTLSLSKAGGTVASNVNRWRRQVGLGPLGADDPPGETITVDGQSGYRAEAFGSENAVKGLVLPRGEGQLLFVKLSGPSEAVRKAEADFDAFVASLKFG